MKRPSGTDKRPELILFLDEGIDCPLIHARLAAEGVTSVPYGELLPRHTAVPDREVIKAASCAGYVLVTHDRNIEKQSLSAILQYSARTIILLGTTAQQWADSLCRALPGCHELSRPEIGPMVIRVGSTGLITKVRGEDELRQRDEAGKQSRIIAVKRHAAAT